MCQIIGIGPTNLTSFPSNRIRTGPWTSSIDSTKLRSPSRERDVVELVTKDKKNHDIAFGLGLKDHTVRNYIFQIFEKLGVSTRVGLVLYALSEPAINEKTPGP